MQHAHAHQETPLFHLGPIFMSDLLICLTILNLDTLSNQSPRWPAPEFLQPSLCTVILSCPWRLLVGRPKPDLFKHLVSAIMASEEFVLPHMSLHVFMFLPLLFLEGWGGKFLGKFHLGNSKQSFEQHVRCKMTVSLVLSCGNVMFDDLTNFWLDISLSESFLGLTCLQSEWFFHVFASIFARLKTQTFVFVVRFISNVSFSKRKSRADENFGVQRCPGL